MGFPDETLTHDGFLGGKLTLSQPRAGYRAATDPVLLAAAVPALPGQAVLDLGCGVGTALLCLGQRVPGLDLTGLEVQADYAELARLNAARNDLAADVLTGDIAAPPPVLRGRVFDHVLTNPPWYDPAATDPAAEKGRDRAHRESSAGLADFISFGLRRLRPGGRITIIQRAERLSDLLAVLATGAGDIAVLPLTARAGRPAKRVLVQARKGARAPLRLLSPLVMHQGDRHLADGADFTPEAADILRNGAPLLLG